jgi:hypothetical protein
VLSGWCALGPFGLALQVALKQLDLVEQVTVDGGVRVVGVLGEVAFKVAGFHVISSGAEAPVGLSKVFVNNGPAFSACARFDLDAGFCFFVAVTKIIHSEFDALSQICCKFFNHFCVCHV